MTAQPTGTGRSGGPVLDEPAALRFTPGGIPLALRWHGSVWQVIGEPAAWTSPDNRPEPVAPAVHGPATLVFTRFWRFQAQTGPASPVLEFDISAGPGCTDWRLRRVTAPGQLPAGTR